MKKIHSWYRRRREQGQTLVLFTVFLVVLLLFVGLGIDLSFAYITRANLSKACDAACLAGMDNYWQGQAAAAAIATNAFSLNYGKSGRDQVAPSPVVTFTTDASGNTTLTVTASATIRTFFTRILPDWKTLTVANTSQSIRAHVIMSVVLDRSGSMDTPCTTGGSGSRTRLDFLKFAVTNFISYFDDSVDRAALVSYSTCPTVNLAMQKPFKAPFRTATLALSANGWTGSSEGMTVGWSQNKGFTPPSGEVVQRVVVFFTDGYANTFSNRLTCGIRNVSGEDIRSFYDPNSNCNERNSGCSMPSSIPSMYPAYHGLTTISTASPTQMIAEAEARAIYWANQARDGGAFVYAVGLNCDSQGPKSNFLAQVANVDGVVDQDKPIGISIIAPTSEDLRDAFHTIAKAILLRLTR